MRREILASLIVFFMLGCATGQLEVNPDLKPGESVGIDVKACFSDEAVNSWGKFFTGTWNKLFGCLPPAEEDDGETEGSTEGTEGSA